MCTAEDPLGMKPVVPPAEDPDVLGLVAASSRLRLDVIELQMAARRASIARGVDEGAPFAVPGEDVSSDVSRDVPPSDLFGRPCRHGARRVDSRNPFEADVSTVTPDGVSKTVSARLLAAPIIASLFTPPFMAARFIDAVDAVGPGGAQRAIGAGSVVAALAFLERVVLPRRSFSSLTSNSSNDASTMVSRSPVGLRCRIRSRMRSSFAFVSAEIVSSIR